MHSWALKQYHHTILVTVSLLLYPQEDGGVSVQEIPVPGGPLDVTLTHKGDIAIGEQMRA